MIITDGSHIVEESKETKMVPITVRYECVATVCAFASDVDTVKKFVKQNRNRIKMPLPFGGQDGSQNLKIKSIIVDGEDLADHGGS